MSFVILRNRLIKAVYDFIGAPVTLADQVSPEPSLPFILYSIVTPYTPANTTGHYETTPQGDGFTITRREDPTCVVSFTACSQNREENGVQVYGEDEALMLAEQLQGWFLHSGYDTLAGIGCVVESVGNPQSRSFLQVDEEARRWGFDVTLRYVRKDARAVSRVEKVNIKEVK